MTTSKEKMIKLANAIIEAYEKELVYDKDRFDALRKARRIAVKLLQEIETTWEKK